LGTLLATGTIAGFAAVAAAPSAHAAFPGTNGPVVFNNETGAPGTTGDIDLLNTSTGVITTICPAVTCGGAVDDRPETTANGQLVAFDNTAGIATVPITGGGFAQITTDNGKFPSFTPDGSTIVYEAAGVLKKVPAGGGTSVSISGAPVGTVFQPEVSPNGATVAYEDNSGGVVKLETIPIGGGLPNVVVNNTAFIDQISWSPDGTRIALVDENHCPLATPIGVVSATANNGAPVCLPNSATNDVDPSFSPDGQSIVVEDTNSNASILGVSGIGRTNIATQGIFGNGYWAPAVNSGGSTTTTTPCFGTLSGSAFKGGNPKPKKALAGVAVTAGAASGTTNAAGTYSITVPCGTVTKTATGPDTKTRVCHFGSKKGPTSVTVTVTSGSNDIESIFCLKK